MNDVVNIQPILDELANLFPDPPARDKGRGRGRAAAAVPEEPGRSVLTDAQVVARLRAGSQGAKFTALFERGDAAGYGGDESRADFALIGLLRWWCRDDAEQIERLMRASALSRGKWDDRRPGGTWLWESIARCIASSNGEVYSVAPRPTFRVFDPERERQRQATPPPPPGEPGDPPGAGDTPPPGNTADPPDPPPDGGDRDGDPAEARGDAVDNPHRLAAAYLASVPAGTVRFWRCEFFEWAGGAFVPRGEDTMRVAVTCVCREQFLLAFRVELADWEAAGDESVKRPAVRKVTVRIVSDVLNAVRSMVCLPEAVRPPCWIDGATGPDPADVVAVRNGLLDASALVLHEHTPSFFTLNALPFVYTPKAEALDWERFMLSAFGDPDPLKTDAESVNAVEEWLGYCLTADLRHDKILLMVGPQRCGKGTIREVLRQLVGEGNYAAVNLDQLGGQFGLQHLPDKLVAADGDARMGGKSDAVAVVKRLLTISGRDPVYIDRKNKAPLNERLTARFAICTNSVPKLPDDSGVIAERFLVLRFSKSFLGKEDKGLEAKLTAELPGILNRALDARRRLRDRGHFVQPASAADDLQSLSDLSNPLLPFLRSECVLEPEAFTPTAELYLAYTNWNERRGRRQHMDEPEFGRRLTAANLPGVVSSRPRYMGKRVQGYQGIRFRGLEDNQGDDD